MRVLWTLSFALLAASIPALGQSTFGEITGVVTDSSVGAIVGATVTATETGTNETRTAITNGTGNYDFRCSSL